MAEKGSRNRSSLSSMNINISFMIPDSTKRAVPLIVSMYDVDGNGFIELSEMTKLVKSIFSMMNNANDRRAHLNPSERARTIFRAMDRDCDGGDKIFFGLWIISIIYIYIYIITIYQARCHKKSSSPPAPRTREY